MQKTRRDLTLRIIVLLVVLSLFTTSVFAEMFTPLKKDALPNNKVSSILFGRILMTSHFKEFMKAEGKDYVLEGSRDANQKSFSLRISIKTLTGKWKGTGEVWGYDSFFAIAAEPGDYSFNKITYKFQNFDLGNYLYINQLTLPFKEERSVGAGALVYFGVINLDFISFDVAAGPVFSYRYNLNVTNEFDTDLEKFQTAYPQLYETFKDNIVIADFVKQ